MSVVNPFEDFKLPDLSGRSRMPTQDDLPCEDGIPMETYRHSCQMTLLIDVLEPWLAERGNGFAGGNMFLYYSLQQVKRRDFIGPDFFVALDVPRGDRKSWVSWDEGKVPDVVLELLSDSTAKHDKTGKKQLYAESVKVPEYFWYDPWNPEDLAGFTLHLNQYHALPFNTDGRLYSAKLNLYLGRWEGSYRGIEAVWARWFTPSGDLLLHPSETAAQQAELAAQQTELAAQQKARADAAEHELEKLRAELARLQRERH